MVKVLMAGIRGTQFGLNNFVTFMTYGELNTHIDVDPDVQRKIDKKKVNAIAKYILDALTGSRSFAAFGAITCSLRYDKINDRLNGEISFNAESKLTVDDGQHRYYGIQEAFRYIDKNIKIAKELGDGESLNHWNTLKQRLSEFTLPVLIFEGLTLESESQLFCDWNNLATPVNPTQALKFDSNDIYNRIAKELESEIPQFNKHGIHKTAKNLGAKNKEIATLAIWNSCIRIILNGYGHSNMKQPWNDQWEYNNKKELVKEFWQTLFEVLPADFNDRNKYMITKSVFLLGLSSWAHQIIRDDNTDWKKYVYQLRGFDWSYENDLFAEFGGGAMVNGKFHFTGSRTAVKSIPLALNSLFHE